MIYEGRNIIYKKECPYCHKIVQRRVISYDQSRDWYSYIFYCDCVPDNVKANDAIINMNEYEAYKNYLAAREEANLTNFDLWDKADGRTFKELNKDIENYCYDNPELVCQNCFWGKLSQNVPTDAQFPTCIDFCEWLLKKVNENV